MVYLTRAMKKTRFIELAPGISYLPNFLYCPDDNFADLKEEIAFQQRTCKVYGKNHKVPRLEAWFGPKPYTFSGMTFPPVEMPPSVLNLAIAASIRCGGGFEFEHCLANLYRDGSDTVSWHSDDDHLCADPLIASISFGAPRDFLMRRKKPWSKSVLNLNPRFRNRIKVTLEHGSLLVMGMGVQRDWEHSLPRRKKCTDERLNLTFRADLVAQDYHGL